MKIKFKCLEDGCDSTKIEEIMESVFQTSEVTEISGVDGDFVGMEYGESLTEGGEVLIYQCSRGHDIAENDEDLLKWLREHKQLEEE